MSKSKWKEYKLGELVKINFKSIDKDYQFKEIQYLDTGSITKGNVDTLQNFLLVKAPSRAKRLVEDRDIIYSTVRPIQRHYGYIKNAHENLVVSTGFAVITSDEKLINSKFLYYYLTSDEVVNYLDMIAEASTSAYPSLRPEDISNLDITIPSLSEQSGIASILSNLDEKIDLLRRQNKTLEAITETLFRQWFVEEAEDSWNLGKISDLIEFNPKRSLSKGAIAPYLEMSNLSNELYYPTYWYDREFSSGTKFVNGDTLLARITPCLENGKTAFVDFLEENQVGWGSTEYIVMRSKMNLHPFFSYVIARYDDFRNYAIGCMVGSSGRQRADVDNIMDYEISIPSEEIIEKFNKSIDTILLKMNNNNIQSRSLIKLRDELLPKLMSGEIIINQ